jgi:copper chaperone
MLLIQNLFFNPAQTTLRKPTMQQNFIVTGMTCGHCEKAVTRAILQADPQAKVTIDRAQNQVAVETTQARETLAKAIAEEGYAVAA